jgi:uncharacterized protein YggE
MSQMPAHASDPDSREFFPTITVRGEAVLRVEPDEAMLWMTLTALENDPGQALADVSLRGEQLAAMLDDLGVTTKDRSTTGVTVYEEFDHTAAGRRSLGHRAAASTSVRLTDPALIGQLITKATTQLQARVDGPRWQIAADNPARLDAAHEAAADGQRKAQAFAAGVGAKLARLVRLEEPDTDHASPRMRRAGIQLASAAAGGPMPIEPGEHEVTAAIDVTFTLELN